MANGYVLWEDATVAFIATGVKSASANRKTGAMVQTWIIRKDMDPVTAVKTGADDAICGTCPHRGINGAKRSCYVNVGQAPLAIFKAFRAGKYPTLEDYGVFKGRSVRLGAYGDPAVVPFNVLEAIVAHATMWTGYTHQWRTADPRLAGLCMASADSVEEYREARRAGYRAFVVVPKDGAFPQGTVECMSTARGITCDTCGACAGTRLGAKVNAVSIAIQAHGIGAKYVG